MEKVNVTMRTTREPLAARATTRVRCLIFYNIFFNDLQVRIQFYFIVYPIFSHERSTVCSVRGEVSSFLTGSMLFTKSRVPRQRASANMVGGSGYLPHLCDTPTKERTKCCAKLGAVGRC